MRLVTRRWSSMLTTPHITGIESDLPRSRVDTSSLVMLGEMMLETWRRCGVLVNLDTVRIRRVNTQRRMFLRM